MINTKKSQTFNNYYSFSKNNEPDGKYLVYEIWEDEHPDKVVAGQKIQGGDEEAFSQKELEKIVPLWRQTAADKGLKHPIITIEGDLGKGIELTYGYIDNRKVIPPNAKFYTIKPIFDKNIILLRYTGKQGKSFVYHSPLGSPTLYEELTNLKKLLTHFFTGEYYELLRMLDKSSDWKWQTELLVDNLKLRSTK